jgi:hydroxypyruvate isomerase
MSDHSKVIERDASRPYRRFRQCIAPFVFGGTFSHTEGFQIVQGFYLQFGGGLTFDDTCRIAAEMGFEGYDLASPHAWPTLKKYGLLPTMSHLGAAGTPDGGIASIDLHERLEKTTRTALQECGEFGAPNIVAMTGPAKGQSLETCADNTVQFLEKVKSQAEDMNVTICLENLNSKVDHKGYLFDHVAWGVEVVKRVDSPKVKLLFDIYHSQVEEGDVVRTLRDNIQWIGHIHTAGNPGRCQIDGSQELNYAYIAREIERLDYAGFLGHEYFPRSGSDPIACMRQAYELFDVSRW